MHEYWLLFLLGISAAGNADKSLPADVARFVERRERCDHFRNEPADAAARRRFVAKQAKKYCDGSDDELRALKSKYSARPKVMARLNRYPAQIEATQY